MNEAPFINPPMPPMPPRHGRRGHGRRRKRRRHPALLPPGAKGQSHWTTFALSVPEVCAIYNDRHGTHYSPERVRQILRHAEAKIARALRRQLHPERHPKGVQ